MKKLIFRRFSVDIIGFFLLAIISTGLIVWIIQAVNYLDFVSEDGHSLKVYLMYSVLSIPKIIGKLTIFVFFISVFFVIAKYEDKNEMIVFWTSGVKKIEFINNLFKISILLLIFQLLFNLFLIPKSQDSARSFLRNSEIDFFPFLIKSKKFIDTVSDLTIFIDSKDSNGVFENVYIQDNSDNKKTQVVLAQKGLLGKKNDNIFLILYSGKILNIDSKKTSIVNFEKTEFNLSKYTTKTTVHPKVQEINTEILLNCVYSTMIGYVNKELFDKYFACNKDNAQSMKQELFKRIVVPFYLPLISLIAAMLIYRSKDHYTYNRFKFTLFCIGISIIILSEVSVRYSNINDTLTILFFIFPFFLFFLTYIFLLNRLKILR